MRRQFNGYHNIMNICAALDEEAKVSADKYPIPLSDVHMPPLDWPEAWTLKVKVWAGSNNNNIAAR